MRERETTQVVWLLFMLTLHTHISGKVLTVTVSFYYPGDGEESNWTF